LVFDAKVTDLGDPDNLIPIGPSKEYTAVDTIDEGSNPLIPTGPNPRAPQLNKAVYREVEDSLLNVGVSMPNTFHLKSKGELFVCDDVRVRQRAEDLHDVEMYFRPGEGLVDGGHTLALIRHNRGRILELNNLGESDVEGQIVPVEQFVEVTVFVGYPKELIPEIAAGRNTGVQVAKHSLLNLGGGFEWIKEALKDESYADQISYFQGDTTTEEKAAPFDVRDVISIVALLNMDLYPHDEPSEQPNGVYDKKSNALEDYVEHPDGFKAAQAILPNILQLHDVISKEGAEFLATHNFESDPGRRGRERQVYAGQLIQKKKRGDWNFPFSCEQGAHRLHRVPNYVVLAAFRSQIKKTPIGLYEWVDSFEDVLEVWDSNKSALMTRLVDHLRTKRGTVSTLGKDGTLYEITYKMLAETAPQLEPALS